MPSDQRRTRNQLNQTYFMNHPVYLWKPVRCFGVVDYHKHWLTLLYTTGVFVDCIYYLREIFSYPNLKWSATVNIVLQSILYHFTFFSRIVNRNEMLLLLCVLCIQIDERFLFLATARIHPQYFIWNRNAIQNTINEINQDKQLKPTWSRFATTHKWRGIWNHRKYVMNDRIYFLAFVCSMEWSLYMRTLCRFYRCWVWFWRICKQWRKQNTKENGRKNGIGSGEEKQENERRRKKTEAIKKYCCLAEH